MGLDMYLEKCNRKVWGYKDFDLDAMKLDKPELYQELKPLVYRRGSERFQWESFFEEVGYWRKANAVHQWFVKNVQGGIDNCQRYEVHKDQLEKLLEICKTIQRKTKMEDGLVKNGEKYTNGVWCPQYQEGQTVVNPEIAAALLPTCEGFFFGSVEYDQWYMEDINSTIEILTKVLDTTNFDIDMIVYCSSW
jgi:hypothetical protein